MKIFLAVTVLAAAAVATELGLDGLKPSEIKEIEKEIAAGNVPPNYVAEKPKRGVAKLTNVDNANFNYLTNTIKPYVSSSQAYTPLQQTYTPAQQTYTQSQQTYTPAQQTYTQAQQTYTQTQTDASAQATPQATFPQYSNQQYRLVYPNQLYQNPYLNQIQNPYIAQQIAAQYAYQPSLPHFVQTPNQIQYVSPNNYQQVPSVQYKALTAKAPVTTADGKTTTTTSTEQATSQVVLPSNAQYHQQPAMYVMYLLPQHLQQLQQQYVYPGQQNQMLLVGAHNPLLGYFGQHRFGVPAAYSAQQATQLAYLQAAQQQQQQQQVPTQYQTLQQTVVDNSGSTNTQQKPINVQDVSATSTNYGQRTKA